MRPADDFLEAHLQDSLRRARDEWRGGAQASELEDSGKALAHEVAARVQQIEGRTVRDRFVRGANGVSPLGAGAAAPKLERHLRDRLRDVQDEVILGAAPDVAAYEAQRARWRKR